LDLHIKIQGFSDKPSEIVSKSQKYQTKRTRILTKAVISAVLCLVSSESWPSCQQKEKKNCKKKLKDTVNITIIRTRNWSFILTKKNCYKERNKH